MLFYLVIVNPHVNDYDKLQACEVDILTSKTPFNEKNLHKIHKEYIENSIANHFDDWLDYRTWLISMKGFVPITSQLVSVTWEV